MKQSFKQPNGNYRCLFCDEKEYSHLNSLYRHHKRCHMNPDADRHSKKRSRSRSSSPSSKGTLYEIADSASDTEESSVSASKKVAVKAYEKLLKGDTTDESFIKGVFARLAFEPVAKGMLIQMLIDKDEEYGRKKEAFAEQTRQNVKTKAILLVVNSESTTSTTATCASESSSSSSGGGGGGGGRMLSGIFGSSR